MFMYYGFRSLANSHACATEILPDGSMVVIDDGFRILLASFPPTLYVVADMDFLN